MIFRKQNPIPQIYRKRYSNEFEYMFVFSKGTVKTHNPIMVDSLHAGLKLGSTTYKNYSKNDTFSKCRKISKTPKQINFSFSPISQFSYFPKPNPNPNPITINTNK